MAQDLVVKMGRCRYLSLISGKWFCALEPLTGSVWMKVPHGRILNISVFEKIPAIDPMKNCIGCLSYIEAEWFLPRVIREKKSERRRSLRLA